MVDHVKETVKPFLEKKGVTIFGVFPRDKCLESMTVAQLNEILNGKVLCCEDKLDEFVENFLIGAMDVDSALNYFRRTPNKAVITGAHRSDIQLAALETSTQCIILTGGFTTNDVVLGKAQAKGIPILSVAGRHLHDHQQDRAAHGQDEHPGEEKDGAGEGADGHRVRYEGVFEKVVK